MVITHEERRISIPGVLALVAILALLVFGGYVLVGYWQRLGSAPTAPLANDNNATAEVETEDRREGREIADPRSATLLMSERYALSGECIDIVFMADERHKSPEDRVANAGALEEQDIREVIAGVAGPAYGPALLHALGERMHGSSGYRFVCDEAGVKLFVGLEEGRRLVITELVSHESNFTLEHITGIETYPEPFIDVFYSLLLERFVVYTQNAAGEPRTWRFYGVHADTNAAELVESCAVVGETALRLFCTQEYTE